MYMSAETAPNPSRNFSILLFFASTSRLLSSPFRSLLLFTLYYCCREPRSGTTVIFGNPVRFAFFLIDVRCVSLRVNVRTRVFFFCFFSVRRPSVRPLFRQSNSFFYSALRPAYARIPATSFLCQGNETTVGGLYRGARVSESMSRVGCTRDRAHSVVVFPLYESCAYDRVD